MCNLCSHSYILGFHNNFKNNEFLLFKPSSAFCKLVFHHSAYNIIPQPGRSPLMLNSGSKVRRSLMVLSQPVGLGKPAILQAPLPGRWGMVVYLGLFSRVFIIFLPWEPLKIGINIYANNYNFPMFLCYSSTSSVSLMLLPLIQSSALSGIHLHLIPPHVLQLLILAY